MNIAQYERSERVFSSTGQYGLTSDNAKFFAYPVQHEGLCFSAHLVKQDGVFEKAWAIYAEAFTGLERRSRREQTLVMRHPCYRFSAILHEGAVVGVMAWWKLAGFCFVEHLAISSAERSGGFGRRAIELLQSHVACPIVVDVEPFGTDQNAARRVAFYSRLGFAYSGKSVTLPAYEGKPTAPSNLMAWGMELDRAGRERVLEAVGREIYNQRVDMPYTSAV